MEDDKRRKPKIPVKNKPAVQWLLTNATGSQLDFLRRLSTGADFKDFINLISKFKDYNVYTVFEYKAKDDKDLALYRAYRKGGVDALVDLIQSAQLAKTEADRRRQSKT